jgi:arsenic resistance protein ArsH
MNCGAALWSEGQVWCSPTERHGQIAGIMKTQIDHLPSPTEGLRQAQGRTLRRSAVQVSAGSQSFNSVNTLRVLGRWMRMLGDAPTSRASRKPTRSSTKRAA